MKIDRTNYEEWLQDWLDDNLTGPEADQLNAFLEVNPDIKAEFEGISSLKLNPEEPFFSKADRLKKNVKDIPDSQFEILCAAYFENDLSDNQKSEVDEMIKADRRKLEIFKSISVVRLKLPRCSFPDKQLLLKKEPSGRIFRLVFAGLSAAAIIALIILSGVLRHYGPKQEELIANEITPADSQQNEIKQEIPYVSELKQRSGEVPESKVNVAGLQERDTADYKSSDDYDPGREPVIIAKAEIIPIEPLTVAAQAELAPANLRNPVIENFDYRTNTGKFISRVFRKEIMKEEQPSESPLHAYEIAEAGIKGMNRLLGWDMAITRNTDGNGEIRSVYFNSRIISFKTPVKKNENGE
jgi:hypothetical protein